MVRTVEIGILHFTVVASWKGARQEAILGYPGILNHREIRIIVAIYSYTTPPQVSI